MLIIQWSLICIIHFSVLKKTITKIHLLDFDQFYYKIYVLDGITPISLYKLKLSILDIYTGLKLCLT